MAIVNEGRIAEAVTAGVRSEMLAIFALTSDSLRARRLRELLGDGQDAAPTDPGDQVVDGGADVDVNSASVAVDADDSGVDPGRFVPVIEREVGGRMVLSALARDVYVFVGSTRGFSHWFDDQRVGCRLAEGVDHREGVLGRSAQNPAGGRQRVDYVLTLDAAKEIGMLDKGPRGKDLRLYFLECERRLEAGELAAVPALRTGAQDLTPAVVGPDAPAASIALSSIRSQACLPPPISVDNMPNSLHAFMDAKGFSHAGVGLNDYYRIAEKALVRSVTEAKLPGHSCCRSPGHGGWLFTRAALNAWWMEHETEVVLASLGR